MVTNVTILYIQNVFIKKGNRKQEKDKKQKLLSLKPSQKKMNISPQRLEEIQNIPDSAIDTSDIPELDDNFWQTAKMVKPITKKAISIRLDSDVLEWFKHQGKGYQSMINTVLRSYINHQENL